MRRERRGEIQIAPLLEYVHELTPRYVVPQHLAPVTARLERVRLEPLRLVVSIPPRHGKTEALLHFIPWILSQDPTVQVVYATYAQRLAEKKSRKARELARRAGVPIAEDASSRANWLTGKADGGVWATGVQGQLTGEGADIAIVDDPHKDRASAESALQREAVWDWFTDVLTTRGEPGASFVVCQTRWHEDDLAGRLIAQGWENVALPALTDDGVALWPERFSADALRGIRETVGEYTWASLYQQQPRPRGGQAFGDVHSYDALPEGLRYRIGADLAYSTKSKSDYSCAVVLGEKDGKFYVVEVVRLQVRVTEFREVLAGLSARYGGVRPFAYIGGQEGGIADLLAEQGLRLDTRPAASDKFIRAQPVSAAWNAGRVLLPQTARWLDAFVSEIVSFTGGSGDVHDDQVDALAAAFDSLSGAVRREARRSTGRLNHRPPPETYTSPMDVPGGGFYRGW